ncbi:hypothetical protein N8339_07835 [Gammaproteobacteria bacterium]|nr:hypothetical protein [Gammaproteobacteria bacterium]
MDEEKAILALVSTVMMHALLARSKRSTDQLVVEAVMVAQQLIDEVHDTVDER